MHGSRFAAAPPEWKLWKVEGLLNLHESSAFQPLGYSFSANLQALAQATWLQSSGLGIKNVCCWFFMSQCDYCTKVAWVSVTATLVPKANNPQAFNPMQHVAWHKSAGRMIWRKASLCDVFRWRDIFHKNFICSSRKVMFETDKESNLHGPPHFTVLFCWLPLAAHSCLRWIRWSGFRPVDFIGATVAAMAVRISHAHWGIASKSRSELLLSWSYGGSPCTKLMLKDKLGPDSLIASPHSCMCSLFQSLFVLLYLLYSIVCSLLSACVFQHFLQWLVAACAFSGRLAPPLLLGTAWGGPTCSRAEVAAAAEGGGRPGSRLGGDIEHQHAAQWPHNAFWFAAFHGVFTAVSEMVLCGNIGWACCE
jgi:hypothetical protein